MYRNWLITGALLAALGVILGAFGAHGLKDAFDDPFLANLALPAYETGVRYHMYHAFAIIACGILGKVMGENRPMKFSFYFFLAGIVLFSGSLYLLSTRTLLGIESWKWLGPITPIGGLCFITGWILLAVAVLKKK